MLDSAGEPIRLEIEKDGVAWLVIDGPGKLNILSSDLLFRLNEVLNDVEREAANGRIRVLVIRSGKEGSFIAGADVNEIAAVTNVADGASKAELGQRLFSRIAALSVPTLAAIDGICLGGATELVLACTHRIASDRPETRIGLPEVQLGILPGFGGTTRLPRLIGLRAALDIILTGKPVNARKAERIGLIDERVPAPILYRRGAEYARLLADGRAPERKKPGIAARLLDATPVGQRMALRQARKMVMKQTAGHYPAPLKILDILPRMLSASIDEALAIEARALGELIATPVSKNLIHVFWLNEGAKKAAPAVPARAVERVGVLGAGVMGGGIAQLLAYRGFTVRLKDIKPEALALGLRHAQELFAKAVQRRRLDKREARRMHQRIAPALDYSGFGATQLVIEAVIERMDIKKTVLRETEARLAGGILTSNTSSLSITEMQSALAQPANFCGMHFFNPVDRMPLVEIIRGAHTSDETVATVFAVARRLEKTPVIVRDGAGFLVNRILAPYLNEAGWLLADGVSVEAIDKALVEFGMPMGPVRLLDEIGLDVARHAATVMFEAFGTRMQPAPPMAALERSRRLGKKGGLGFYVYEDGKQKGVDESVYAELGITSRGREIARSELQSRCVFVMVNEAARILQDGVAATPSDVDIGMIFGTGFPPFRGGLLKYADAIGTARIAETLDRYTRELGPRFEVAPLLREKARAGGTFYGS